VKHLKRLRDISYELEAPINLSGIEGEPKGDYTLGKDLPQEEWHTTEVIVLGCNYKKYKFEHELGQEGEAIWEFNISHLPKKEEIVGADLRIITFRTHGGLHIPFRSPFLVSNGKGNLILRKQNGDFYRGELSLAVGNEDFQCVDKINIVKPMSHGDDYGFNRLDPYPIVNWLLKARESGKLKVKLRVDAGVFWDVDGIRIESIVVRKEPLRQDVLMIFGALISASVGLIANAIGATVASTFGIGVVLGVAPVVMWLLSRPKSYQNPSLTRVSLSSLRLQHSLERRAD